MNLTKVKIKAIKKIESSSKRYDIEVEDNHNFFANGILVHNCSATFAVKDNKFYACSRNLTRKIEKIGGIFNWIKKFKPKINGKNFVNDNVWEEVAIKFSLKEKLSSIKRNLAIQGEIVGPGIQENKYNLEEINFYCFGAYDIDNKEYLSFEEWLYLMSQLSINHVPLLESIEMKDIYSVDDLLVMASGKSVIANIPKEGIVLRLTYGENGEKISFKAINNDFLLKFGE